MRTRVASVVLLVVALVATAILLWNANRNASTTKYDVKVLPTVEHMTGSALVDPKPLRRYKVGVLFPFMASPFWVNEAFGILDQAKIIGIEVIWLSADGYDNIQKQNNQIEDLVTQRVDAILLAATSSTGTVPAVDRAAAAGIPVFAHVTSSDTDKILSSVIDDDLGIGKAQADFMGMSLGGKGFVAMLDGPAAADWATRRVRGFKAELAARFPGIRVVAERNGIPDRSDAQRLTEDILSANPKLDGLFTVADGMAMGAADAVAAVNRTAQITITTASLSRESIPFIKKGMIKLNVDENPMLMGRAAINNVVNGLNGIPVPKIIFIPNPSVTAANLAALDPARQWAPEGWSPQ